MSKHKHKGPPTVYAKVENDLDRLLSGKPTDAIRAQLQKDDKRIRDEKARKEALKSVEVNDSPVTAIFSRQVCKCGEAESSLTAIGRYITLADHSRILQATLGLRPARVEVNLYKVEACTKCLIGLPTTYRNHF